MSAAIAQVRCWRCKKWECLETCQAYQAKLLTLEISHHRQKDIKRDWTLDHKLFVSRWCSDVRSEFKRAAARVHVFTYMDLND